LLEQIRLLLNLETATRKLLRIILVGQPQLRKLLLDPELAQLNQRITLRWHLGRLSSRETIAYVHHRLAIASGGRATRLFTRPAPAAGQAARPGASCRVARGDRPASSTWSRTARCWRRSSRASPA